MTNFLKRDDYCQLMHDDIDTLFGVEPMPVEKLPKTCECGAPLTYAADVTFVSWGAVLPAPTLTATQRE
jgi:hypothetical protein